MNASYSAAGFHKDPIGDPFDFAVAALLSIQGVLALDWIRTWTLEGTNRIEFTQTTDADSADRAKNVTFGAASMVKI